MNTLERFINRIIHDDCIEAMRSMPPASIDLIATDPPYIVNYRSRDGRRCANDDNSQWLMPSVIEMFRVLKPDSFCVSFYGWGSVELFMSAWKTAGFTPVGHLVWAKSYRSRTGFTQSHHECAYLLAKGSPAKPPHAPRDVLPWRYTGNKLHPTQKPVTAMTPLIKAFSQPGDVVLDPFAGSGTTAVAARQLGRAFVGIECVEAYHRAAVDRLIRFDKQCNQTKESARR